MNVHEETSSDMTRAATFLVIMSGIISFLGSLPRFAPYLLLYPNNFSKSVPRIWVILTSSFYNETLFSLFLTCMCIMYTAKMIEPVWGSKEYLRFIIMNIIYTNLVVMLFAWIMYWITSEKLILTRLFDTSGCIMNAVFVALACIMKNITIPTQLCNFRPSTLPFYSLCFQFVIYLVTKCDSFLTTVVSTFLSFIYIRYLQPLRGRKGDPDFTIDTLLPAFCCCGEQQQDMELGPNPLVAQREINNTRGNPPPPPPGNNRNPFAGRGRTIA